MVSCENRPRSGVALVDRAFANMYCTEHFDLAHHSKATLFDKSKENWEVFTKGFSKGE